MRLYRILLRMAKRRGNGIQLKKGMYTTSCYSSSMNEAYVNTHSVIWLAVGTFISNAFYIEKHIFLQENNEIHYKRCLHILRMIPMLYCINMCYRTQQDQTTTTTQIQLCTISPWVSIDFQRRVGIPLIVE